MWCYNNDVIIIKFGALYVWRTYDVSNIEEKFLCTLFIVVYFCKVCRMFAFFYFNCIKTMCSIIFCITKRRWCVIKQNCHNTFYHIYFLFLSTHFQMLTDVTEKQIQRQRKRWFKQGHNRWKKTNMSVLTDQSHYTL